MVVQSASKASRSLVLQEGTSNKFWTIELDGSSHTVTFGRIGTAGQTQTKEFADDATARKAFEKLVAEKLKKGYVDVPDSAGATSATTTTAASTVTRKAAAMPKAVKPALLAPNSNTFGQTTVAAPT